MSDCSDVLVVGGGTIGLAIALELRLRGASVVLLTRDFAQAASHAAAGMLAPQAERLLPGAMLELCLQSRSLYPNWIRKLEALTGLETDYWNCGILAPVFEDKPRTPPANLNLQIASSWLDRGTLHQQQPGLSEAVMGGDWYPHDGQVDNRKLTQALWAAVQDLGVEVRHGVTVESVQIQYGRAIGVQTTIGNLPADNLPAETLPARNPTGHLQAEHLQAGHYILATGAWSQALLPVPVTPKKGQMLSLQTAKPWLKTVLYGSEVYIVPRRDGRIVVGATSEDVGFAPGNTDEGIETLRSAAVRLVPALQSLPIQESWWGFRPATPDELPILGPSPYENLTLATGHYRNGILLTPITALLIADLVWNQQSHPLLRSFHWSRFQT